MGTVDFCRSPEKNNDEGDHKRGFDSINMERYIGLHLKRAEVRNRHFIVLLSHFFLAHIQIIFGPEDFDPLMVLEIFPEMGYITSQKVIRPDGDGSQENWLVFSGKPRLK